MLLKSVRCVRDTTGCETSLKDSLRGMGGNDSSVERSGDYHLEIMAYIWFFFFELLSRPFFCQRNQNS